MHELSIAGAVVDTALRHAGGRRVTTVSLQVGALRQVVPESLGFYFEIVARDTACEGARLEQELVAAWLRCPSCGQEWDPAPPPLAGHTAEMPLLPGFRCPACERAETEVVRGAELEVESIEVSEAEEDACTAPR